MQVVSLLKREGGTKITIAGKLIHFTPNEAGDHVADVTDATALDRLVNEIPEGFALYGEDAGKKVAKAPKGKTTHFEHPLAKKAKEAKDAKDDGLGNEPVKPLIIKNPEGQEIDLMQMDLDALRKFATEEMDIDVHAKWKEQTIRDKIVEATRAAE